MDDWLWVAYRLIDLTLIGVSVLIALGVWGGIVYAIVHSLAWIVGAWREIRPPRDEISLEELSPDLQARIWAALAWRRLDGEEV